MAGVTSASVQSAKRGDLWGSMPPQIEAPLALWSGHRHAAPTLGTSSGQEHWEKALHRHWAQALGTRTGHRP